MIKNIISFVLAQVYTYYVFFVWQTEKMSLPNLLVISCSMFFFSKMIISSLTYFFKAKMVD